MTDRLHRWRPDLTAHDGPLATIGNRQGALRLIAVNAAARQNGIGPGMALTDARAILPTLKTVEAEPLAEARALEGLADWCQRYTPWAATDGTDGLLLDVSGCAHLFGGEAALLSDLGQRLTRIGYAHRLALAETPGAAVALARHGHDPVMLLPPGETSRALSPLPVAALRLDGASVEALIRLGLRRIGDLENLPRAPLAARFTRQIMDQLDRAHGRKPEPVSPRRPPPQFHCRLSFADPIGRTEDVQAALSQLLTDLCTLLTAAHKGARRLRLTCYRTDGTTADIPLGLGRPARDAAHITRLFDRHIDGLDVGFGIDVMTLAATATDPFSAQQIDLAARSTDSDVAKLTDRLANRLGAGRVLRFRAVASHIPERAFRSHPAAGKPLPPQIWPSGTVRPLRLLAHPEPVEAMAPVPDEPPLLFRWRDVTYRLRQSGGPERIAAEWWRASAPTRDYYRVEDETGRRFWLCREGLHRPDGPPPRWYLHGFFA